MEHLGETSILQKTNISNNSIQKSSKIGKDRISKIIIAKSINPKKKQLLDDPEHISDTTDNESLLEELIIPNKQKVNEKFYKCSNCQKTFNSRGSLARHMRVHVRETSENSFRCTDCKKPFKYKGSLESHLLIHHSNKMDRTIADVRKIKNLILFECFTCHKILKSRYRLNLHKLVHSDKRQFQCELCKKTFKTKSSLYQHKQIHRNERKFKCDTCGNSFNFKCHLIRHFQVHKNLT